jgi:ABC-type uncharacterized transport system permease subunit
VTFSLLPSSAAALLYALAGWRALQAPQNYAWVQRLVLPAALILHAVALSSQIFSGSSMRIGVVEAASMLTWLSALMLWVFCLREPLQSLGLVHYPVSAVCTLLPALFVNQEPPLPVQEWRIGVHIGFSLLSAGLLTLAAIHAVALAILDRILHRPDAIALARRLPPLQTVESLLFQLIFVGFFLLSLTIFSGLVFVHDLFGQHLVHKTVLTVCAWIIFGVLLWGRARYGWRGRRAIRWTLAGYATLIVAYFGSKLILEQILGRHWS